MPVFKSGKGTPPDWCEMEFFEVVDLSAGATHTFQRSDSKKEKLIVGSGKCTISYNGHEVAAEENTNLDLTRTDDQFEVLETSSDTTLIRMCGRWGEDTGGSGLFRVGEGDNRVDKGDPVDYPKETGFDNHFHDCDEYWIVFEGRGIAVSEGKSYEVGPGDCIATGMGHHHDFPQVFENVKSVFFETTFEREKRNAHLWNHTHGQAQPKMDRV